METFFRKYGIAALLTFLVSLTFAQEPATRLFSVEEGASSLVVAHANGEREDAVRFIWDRQSPGSYDMMAISRDGVFPSAKATDVLKAVIGGYLDTQIKFGTDGVSADVATEELSGDLESLVNAFLSTTGIAPPDFRFSASTKETLGRLTRIDWSNTSYALEGNPNEDKYVAIYRVVRSQREALENSIEQDLAPFNSMLVSKEHVFIANESDATVCGTVFDQDKYMCALDLTMNEVFVKDSQPGLSLELLSEEELIPELAVEQPTAPVEEVKVRKRDRWLKDELGRLNARMDQLDNTKDVMAIRDRIDVLEDRLADIEDQLEEVKRDPPSYDNPISNLSELTGKNVTIRFASGSTRVGAEYMVLLNEVFEHLARSPDQRILITGYSDKSGNAARNLKLSELRAKAVRQQLLQRGISSDRVLVNYYGESKSSKVDVSERRVEIEWLRP